MFYIVKDEEIREKCGEDAVHYLSFQRHIIGLLVVVGVLSVGIILPVNFSGNLLETKTVKISNFMKKQAYENCVVLEARICFNVDLFIKLDKKIHSGAVNQVVAAPILCLFWLLFFLTVRLELNVGLTPRLFLSGFMFDGCFCSSKGSSPVNLRFYSVNPEFQPSPAEKQADRYRSGLSTTAYTEHLEEAVSFYTKLEAQLKDDYRKEREKVNRKPLGMAFVTFQNEAITAIILKDFNACKFQGCQWRREPKISQFSGKLHTHNWTPSPAEKQADRYRSGLSTTAYTEHLEEAVSFYTKLEAQLKDDYRKEREKVNRKPLGMAFVTFQNEAITAIILKDFNACKFQGCQWRREPKISQFSGKLHTHNWTPSPAEKQADRYRSGLSTTAYTEHLEEAVSFYTKLEAQLKDDYRKEREKVNRKPLGMAFVTFQNEAITAIILKDFNACKFQGCQWRREPKISQFSGKLHTHNWTPSPAEKQADRYRSGLSTTAYTEHLEEAVSFYTKLEAQLKDDYRKEREKVNRKPLGMAFVTFQNEAITAIILKDFNACKFQGCQWRREPKISQFSGKLHTHNWTPSPAEKQADRYRSGLSTTAYTEHLLSFMGLNRLEDGQQNGGVDGYLPQDAWHRLAQRAQSCFRRAPSFHFMRGSFHAEPTSPISYYEFVIDPDSFSRTVENIFHTSFLIRDGLARMYLDEDKLPCIAPVEEGEAEAAESSNRKQGIVSINPKIWKELIDAFDITATMIPQSE
ncbi:non-structural maintenance of chromosomes element 4 homolog A [Xyrichtys novacula]|uniref:Non-structural maintenance of chromosomes element 4 homolog A n=1 Tax=Xyrichtys novacula TaxID=13765 RepID=A0AAV1G3Y7_XYRNO|nr:non-structural maintenance of chromosomes element 4 homolog A [Xyrichtys novacula]